MNGQESSIDPRAIVAAAILSSVLYIGASVATGILPAADASPADVVAWFHEHRSGVRWYVLAVTLNTPLLAFVFAYLRRILPPLLRDMYFLGATVLLVTTAVQAWTWGGLALRANDLDPVTAHVVLGVALLWGPVLTGATIAMMAPVTWLALRARAGLPRWLGIFGLVAIAEQALETVTIFGESGFTAPGGPMNLQLGAGLVGAWMLAFPLWAARRMRA